MESLRSTVTPPRTGSGTGNAVSGNQTGNANPGAGPGHSNRPEVMNQPEVPANEPQLIHIPQTSFGIGRTSGHSIQTGSSIRPEVDNFRVSQMNKFFQLTSQVQSQVSLPV